MEQSELFWLDFLRNQFRISPSRCANIYADLTPIPGFSINISTKLSLSYDSVDINDDRGYYEGKYFKG